MRDARITRRRRPRSERRVLLCGRERDDPAGIEACRVVAYAGRGSVPVRNDRASRQRGSGTFCTTGHLGTENRASRSTGPSRSTGRRGEQFRHEVGDGSAVPRGVVFTHRGPQPTSAINPVSHLRRQSSRRAPACAEICSRSAATMSESVLTTSKSTNPTSSGLSRPVMSERTSSL